jgi:hypothetical protein
MYPFEAGNTREDLVRGETVKIKITKKKKKKEDRIFWN